KSGSDLEEVELKVVNLLDQVIADCGVELPLLDVWSCVTQLDRALRHLRLKNLQQIEEAATALKHGPATDLSTVLDQAEDWALRLRTMAEEVSGCVGWVGCLCVKHGPATDLSAVLDQAEEVR
uniref:Ferlin A-domain domain-containing protein n=1 Tax=Hucho hucho TaxID=62062 RepID=A0A4W5KLG9_9TELE